MAGAVLALATATGVSAYWQAQQTIPGTVVTSGDLDITGVTWSKGTDWGVISPGQTVSNQATITYIATGANLSALLSADVTNSAAFDEWITRSAVLGACGASTESLPLDVTPAPGEQQAIVCVSYTLFPTAPASLQTLDLTPTVAFALTQAGSP